MTTAQSPVEVLKAALEDLAERAHRSRALVDGILVMPTAVVEGLARLAISNADRLAQAAALAAEVPAVSKCWVAGTLYENTAHGPCDVHAPLAAPPPAPVPGGMLDDDHVECDECGQPRPRCPLSTDGDRCNLPATRHSRHHGDSHGWTQAYCYNGKCCLPTDHEGPCRLAAATPPEVVVGTPLCLDCGKRNGENGEHDFHHPFRPSTPPVQQQGEAETKGRG